MSLSGQHIANIRKDYQLAALDDATTGDDPLAFFAKWFAEAEAAEVPEVNAMTLATADAEGRPHARIVLLKGLEEDGFVFYTNYNSSKGTEIATNNQVALVFFWQELERQVRIEGTAEKVSDEKSDIYFNSRPEGSRIGAWASPQSKIISDRSVLEENVQTYTNKFQGESIPRPAHWGGYSIKPNKIEFWQGRSSRLHDRITFTLHDNHWAKRRLAP